jgi:hypothetical protein
MDETIKPTESPPVYTIIFHRTVSDICDGAANSVQTAPVRPAHKVVLLVAIFCASLIIASDLPAISEISGGCALALLLGWWWGPFRGIRSLGNPRLLSNSLVPVQLQLSPAGIYISEKTYTSSHSWRKVSSVEINRRGFYIMLRSLGRYSAVFIPRRAFSDWQEMATVRKSCLDFMSVEIAGDMQLPVPGATAGQVPPGGKLRTAPGRIATIILWILLLIVPTLLYFQFSLAAAKCQAQNAVSHIIPSSIRIAEERSKSGGPNGAGKLGHGAQALGNEAARER